MFLKLFRNKVEAIARPEELILEMKSVSENVILLQDEPVLEEKEMLSVIGDSLAENIFCGFNVKIIDLSSNLLFKFDSMMYLNMFLARSLGVEEGFLAKVRERDSDQQLESINLSRTECALLSRLNCLKC